MLGGAIVYALEIYFDFAGYSDMAIGLGRMLGFHFNENFNLPISHRAFPNFGADGIFRYLLGFGVMFTSRWEAIENIYI